MSTPRNAIPLPIGTDFVTRAAYIAALNAIDLMVGAATTDALSNKKLNDLKLLVSPQGGNHTVLANEMIQAVDATAGSVTITLPAATGSGRAVLVVKTDATGNSVVLAAAGADTIDGATSGTTNVQFGGFLVLDRAAGTWWLTPWGFSAVSLTRFQTLLNKTLTSPIVTGNVAGAASYTQPALLAPKFPVTAVSANYAVAVNDTILHVDATAGPITITMPAATVSGRMVLIYKKDGSLNDVTIQRVGGETIDGQVSVVLTKGNEGMLLFDKSSGMWSAHRIPSATDITVGESVKPKLNFVPILNPTLGGFSTVRSASTDFPHTPITLNGLPSSAVAVALMVSVVCSFPDVIAGFVYPGFTTTLGAVVTNGGSSNVGTLTMACLPAGANQIEWFVQNPGLHAWTVNMTVVGYYEPAT